MRVYYQLEDFHLGVQVTQRIYDRAGEKVAKEAREELLILEKKISGRKNSSELTLVNENAGIKPINVSQQTLEAIRIGREYSLWCNGYFDITCGPLVRLWEDTVKIQGGPTPRQVKEALHLVGARDVLVNETEGTIWLKRKGQKINLGAIEKGYVTDIAIETYKKYGITQAYISWGDSIAVLGNAEDNMKWRVGLKNPLGTGNDCIGCVSVKDRTLFTSTNERCYVDQMKGRVTINPQTGTPLENDLISVTVICEKATDGDALSTALLVMGLEKGLEFVSGIKGISAIFITQDKKVHCTDDLRKEFELIDNQYAFADF